MHSSTSLMNHSMTWVPTSWLDAGMDDAGRDVSWYVLNAIGLYTYSPADPEYIVTVPLFDKVTFNLNGRFPYDCEERKRQEDY